MIDSEESFSPGLASTVLGSVGMLLFFLPILGAPLSAVGLLVGMIGACLACYGREVNLRLSVAGLLLCTVALATNLAMAFGPIDLVPSYSVAPMWQPVPNRPYVPPPSLPLE
jgi:hypothetical protein